MQGACGRHWHADSPRLVDLGMKKVGPRRNHGRERGRGRACHYFFADGRGLGVVDAGGFADRGAFEMRVECGGLGWDGRQALNGLCYSGRVEADGCFVICLGAGLNRGGGGGDGYAISRFKVVRVLG